ncbi:biotin-dependent enzyme [Halospina denitrificans]|uniref:acetyl-CoA carboxylase n=1 Tax=Halospina denitrificans TaxID=332522 RepID=A0A4V3EQD1_9GAMM|nr:carboxyl transferase domain-containing protein [Halospina denitrificans]TDT41418.1 biotin-dependent enzyme [Halospina denitrificans]
MSRSLERLLIANRGEIAIRIARSADEQGVQTLAVYSLDDAESRHRFTADDAAMLDGTGAAAYQDIDGIIRIALDAGCDAIHPGYGFLSENPELARQCEQNGLIFVGPRPEVLEVFGDKTLSRELAQRCSVPLVPGTPVLASVAEASEFMQTLEPPATIMIKAIAGGGGRGMRVVQDSSELQEAVTQAQREARAAFGDDRIYAERYLVGARHIEVQIAGDGSGDAVFLGDRDCSIQRQRQKLVEIAPAPFLTADTRDAMADAAIRMASEVLFRGVATFEFLIDSERPKQFYFLECNPRIQVEHTVTEEVTGLDLVRLQLHLAVSRKLDDSGIMPPPSPQGFAVQSRVNLESIEPTGETRPGTGRITAYDPPGGPAVRVDDAGYAGFTVPPGYDTLIAKVIARGPDLNAALKRNYRALCEFRLEGVPHNLKLLCNIVRRLRQQDVPLGTDYVENHLPELVHQHEWQQVRFPPDQAEAKPSDDSASAPVDANAILSPCSGRVAAVYKVVGDSVQPGESLAVIEAMKMEFPVSAAATGLVQAIMVGEDTMVHEGDPIMALEAVGLNEAAPETEESVDLEAIRDDLAEVLERHETTRDRHRSSAVEKRHQQGHQTARENLSQLLDDGSFLEYGALALAAQRRRRPFNELLERSPADGLVAGTGTVNAGSFGSDRARCLALAYDYTVFAGTQGVMNHKKTDRLLKLAREWSMPVVLFAEGGGGRPGDTDYSGVSGLDVPTFSTMAALSGTVPLVSVVTGRCFAGNAALAGCTDVIIATRTATLGMAGPAMIEGGGLGRFRPEEVGPVDVQAPNGVIDIVTESDAEAVETARQYLGYFQGDLSDWEVTDQRHLRHRIPESRVRIYDVRALIQDLADQGTVLELRTAFAPAMITALIRIGGKPFGLMANNPAVLGGAINASAADKAARFMQLCGAFGIPLVSLCDTPGFMVGPEAEKEATVRHVSRLFVTAAGLQVPVFTIVLRKGYGLGAQAMAGGNLHAPVFTAAWPTGEFGAMGLEGAVRLGYAEELAAVEDPTERQALFDQMVSRAYEEGKALNTASYLEIDAVIDPADTRHWILQGLMSCGDSGRTPSRPAFIDTW